MESDLQIIYMHEMVNRVVKSKYGRELAILYLHLINCQSVSIDLNVMPIYI